MIIRAPRKLANPWLSSVPSRPPHEGPCFLLGVPATRCASEVPGAFFLRIKGSLAWELKGFETLTCLNRSCGTEKIRSVSKTLGSALNIFSHVFPTARIYPKLCWDTFLLSSKLGFLKRERKHFKIRVRDLFFPFWELWQTPPGKQRGDFNRPLLHYFAFLSSPQEWLVDTREVCVHTLASVSSSPSSSCEHAHSLPVLRL